LQPQSVSALRRAAQLSFQYGLYADAYPYYEGLARIYRSQEEGGGERLWEVFQEITRVPMKETKQKIRVFERIFPGAEGLFGDPYEPLIKVAQEMGKEEESREDAVNLIRWIVGYYDETAEALEILVPLLHQSGSVNELKQAVGRLESIYRDSNRLEEKQDFLDKYRKDDDGILSAPETFVEEAGDSVEISADQVKVKMEANIYDLLKKKAKEQQSLGTPDQGEDGKPMGGSPLDRLEFDDLFGSFKESIQGQIAEDDSETHYNLGVAYQEMELYEDAINEFEVASNNPALQHDAYFMMGNCCREMENLEEALHNYERALDRSGLSDEQINAIRYEQAVSLRSAGRNDDAVKLFREIQSVMGGDYRDSEQQLQELLSDAKG